MSVIKRSLSIVLVVSMLLSMFTFISYASDTTDNDGFETTVTEEDTFSLDFVEPNNEFAEEDIQETTSDSETVSSATTSDLEDVSELEPEGGEREEQEESSIEDNDENSISSDENIVLKITESNDNEETEISESENEHEEQEDSFDTKSVDNSAEEKLLSDETSEIDATDEDVSIEEAELMIDWLYKDRVVEIAVNGAVARKDAKSSAKVMKTYSVGAFVKLVDKKLFSDWYKTSDGYWIYGSNLREHKHTGGTPTTKTWYEHKNNDKHVYHTEKSAVVCRCGETVSKSSHTEKKQDHSYNGVGYCTNCKYTYSYSTKKFSATKYQTKEAVSLRTQPYDSASTSGSLSKGAFVSIVGETKNAFDNKWFLTSDGKWIYSSWVSKHSHSYNDSTGLCSCGAEKSYSTASTKSIERWEVTSDLYLKTRPFSGADNSTYVAKGTVLLIDKYTYTSFLGIKNPSWYRTTDGKWVHEDKIKEHKHTSFSGGICKSTGCDYEFELKIEPIKNQGSAVQYETMSDGVELKVAPYNNRQTKTRINPKGTIILIKAKTKNSHGNTWYQTSDGYWVYSMDVVEHKHKIVAGSCDYANCNFAYQINPTTINEKAYVTTIANVQSYKLPYFDSKVLKVYKSKNTNVIINSEFKNNKGERWYRAVNGEWFYFDSLKAHVHNYEDGVCTSCGADEPIQIVSMASTVYETKKANVPVYKKPYDTSAKIKTLKAKGTTISIIGKATNNEGKLWYLTSDSSWVSSNNITKNLLMNPGNAFSTIKDKFVLRVVDSNKKGVANATVSFGNQTGTTNAQGYVELGYVNSKLDLTISASNYETVTRNSYMMPVLRTDTITISKAGSAEITSAILTRSGKYTDVMHTEVIMNQASNNLRFDIKVTSNVKNVKEYRLVQNGKTMATSTTGEFTNLVADDFIQNVSVSAQVVDTSGAIKATRKLLISVIYKAGSMPASLTLGDKFKITFPQTAPFPFSGMSMELKAPNNFPVYVEINEDKIRGAINFKPKSNEAKNEKWWSELKKLNNTSFKNYYEKYVVNKPPKTNKPSLSLKFGGYIEGATDSSYVQGKIFIGVECKYGIEFPIPVPVIPLVGEFSFKGTLLANGTVRIDEIEKLSGDINVTLDITLGLYLGIGYKGVASIGGYGDGTLSNKLAIFPEFYFDESYVTASIGAKAKLLGKDIFNVKLLQFENYYLYKHGAELNEATDFTSDDYYAWLFDADSYQTMDRAYLDERSGWYENDVELLEDESVVLSQFDFETLQSNTYTDIRPQVATTENTIMMAYLDDNANRDADNRTMLVYSLYNVDTEKWSEPTAVYNNDMADFNFSLVSNGEAIYIVWQKANEEITPEMTVTDISKITDLYIAKFDEAMGSFQNIEQVTADNDVYEMMPRVSSVNGKTVVAWFENSEGDVYGQEGFNKIRYAVKLDKDYAPGPESDISDDEFLPSDTVLDTPVEVDDETDTDEETIPTEWNVYDVDKDLPAITSLAVGYMLEDGYIAFTIDEDKDYSTIDDQKIYLVSVLTNEVILYTDKAMNVEFVKVHGDNAMTWYNQGYIYYSYSPDYAPQMIYSDAGIPCDEYHILSADNGDMAILYTIKGNNQSDAYVILYDDETFDWGLPIQVTKQEKYIQNFNGAYYDEMIVSIFNKTDVNTDTLFEKNDLCCAVIGERYDLMVENVIFEDLELEPDTEYPLIIDVKNNGTRRVNSFELSIASQGTVIDEKTITTSIKPGETYTIETSILMPAEVEATTFTIEIDHAEVADADITNNVSDVKIGRANLFVEIGTAAEETQNMLYISVVNKGYTTSSGSIVLYDENFNIVKTLVESIDEIGYYETYNCTVALDSEVFGGEMYKSFFVGVVPTAEQYTSDYNSTSIYLKNASLTEDAQVDITEATLTVPQESISLMENFYKTIAGNVRNENEEIIENAQIVVMAFDSNGIYLGSKFQSVTLEAGESAEFSVDFDTEVEIDSVKVSIINPLTLEALSDFTEISIYDESIEESSEDEEALYNELIEVEEEY